MSYFFDPIPFTFESNQFTLCFQLTSLSLLIYPIWNEHSTHDEKSFVHPVAEKILFPSLMVSST